MNVNLHILDAKGRFAKQKETIRKNFEAAVEKVKQKLPIDNVDVTIFDNPENVIPELGIVGYTPNAHEIQITLDSIHPKFEKAINQHLAGTLAHEMHHIMRWRGPGYGKTLLEALVTEGLADHFDLEVNRGEVPLWAKALTSKQLEELSQKAKQEWHNENYDHHAWFFGSKERNIPRWTGYSLGFELVEKYLDANPSQKPSAIYNLEAEEFIL